MHRLCVFVFVLVLPVTLLVSLSSLLSSEISKALANEGDI